MRTLDRLRVQAALADRDLAGRREAIFQLLAQVEVVELTRPVLARAAQPMPTQLGPLDAIHLATALVWKDREGQELTMATHDGGLAIAARTFGIRVLGE